MQGVGYVYDAVWHGWLNPGLEPPTTEAMARHLGAVHLPLYFGALSVLVATFTVLVDQARRSSAGIAVPIAFAGAVLSAGAEAWPAASHMKLDTHSAPIAGVLSVVGFFVAVIATYCWGRRSARRDAAATSERHRAA